MSKDRWTAVDSYIAGLLLSPDAAQDATTRASDSAGLPSIAVSPAQGKMLSLMARACGARNILEIGTLGGYSTIWLARALPSDGRLVTLELSGQHAGVARANVANAGFSAVVDVRVGPAADSLRKLAAEGRQPFDFVFIDADKGGYPEYLTLTLPLCHAGTLIVADNVVRDGAVADVTSSDENVRAVRRFNEMMAAEPRLSSTIVQTVGVKGYDGFALAMVVS